MLDRKVIIDALGRVLPTHDVFRAAWLGGSEASGRSDDLSDVDVFLVVEEGAVERAVERFEAIVAELSPIRLKWRLPMPSWHGFHQAFYQLEDAPEHLMIDWLMIERSQSHPWLEVERHATPIVLFDHDGVVQLTHVDGQAVSDAVEKKVAELRVRFPMFKHLAPKQLVRGLSVDGAAFYQSLVLRPLVDLLRATYCPERHDYGFRYLRDDLPAEAYRAVEALSYVAGSEQLEQKVRDAEALFDRTLVAYDARKNR